MSWPALGHDPAPGDEGAVVALADRLGRTSRDAEELVDGLRAADGQAGPKAWDGPAAHVFRGMLHDVPPAVYALTTAYLQAEQALRRYARELADAQHDARRAENEGEQALSDRARARSDKARADDDVRAYAAQAAAAQARWIRGQADRLLAPLDATYQAQMHTYLTQLAAQRDAARAQEAEARRRAAAAARAANEADQRLARARARGDDAGRDRTDAVWRLVTELRSAQPPARSWNWVPDIAQLILKGAEHTVGAIDLLGKYGIAEGPKRIQWAGNLGFVREGLKLTAKQAKKLKELAESTHLDKVLVGLSIGIDAAEAWREQQAEDAEKHPTMSDEEHHVRDLGAATATAGLKITEFVVGKSFADWCAGIGASVGSAVPGIGTAAGAVIGGLLGSLYSDVGEQLLKKIGVDNFVRRLGAIMADALYHKIGDIVGHHTSSVTAGAEDTAGEIWKELTAA